MSIDDTATAPPIAARARRAGGGGEPIADWAVSHHLVPYAVGLDVMERRAAAIAAGTAPELVWLLQHPALYTAGTSAKATDLVQPDRFPVHVAGRGGQYTYHGPGQRVVYVMLDVGRRYGDVRAFVGALEAWIIAALADLGVAGGIRPGRVGVWVERPDKGRLADGSGPVEDKIAAIGIRVRRWVSFHGLSLNVAPDLEHFAGIVPCGITEHGVTSLADLGRQVTMGQADAALRRAFEATLGPTRDTAAP